MEVLEKEKILSIRAGKEFSIKSGFVDAGIVIILVWGVFAILVCFFSRESGEIFPYFIAITLLLLVPFGFGILLRQSRQFSEVLFDGEKQLLLLRRLWRRQQVSFDQINGLQISKYRFKKSLFLYRFEVVLTTGETLRLIQDVPDMTPLRSLGKKAGELVGMPLSVPI